MGRSAEKTNMKPHPTLPAIVLSLLLTAIATGQEPIIRVALRPFIESSNEVVRVGEVAQVTTSNPRLKDAIDQLDLADAPARGASKTISREQLELRLALAGVSSSEASVTGASSVRIVYRPENMRDETVLAAIRQPLAEKFSVAVEDLELQLAQPLSQSLAELEETSALRLAPRLPDSVSPGRLSIPVAVYQNDQLKQLTPVAVEAKVRQLVARVSKPIQSGEAFTAENVVWEKIAVSGSVGQGLARDLNNARARRSLSVGVWVRDYDVAGGAARTEQEPILVRSRDLVRVTARKGGLRVVLSAAQALQQGKLNEVIRLRNTQTGKIITGKVVGPGQVETEL